MQDLTEEEMSEIERLAKALIEKMHSTDEKIVGDFSERYILVLIQLKRLITR